MFVLPSFKENLNKLRLLIETIRGKVDVKSRLDLLLNPSNIKTSSRLNDGQIDFVSLSFYISDIFPQFDGLKKYAKEFSETSISKSGLGREESIRFMASLNESKLLEKLGFTKTIAEKIEGQ